MKYVVWPLLLLLVILHQDYWQWEKGNLVFGFLPYALFYHVVLSIAAAVVWLVAVQCCWPDDLDGPAVDDQEGGGS